MKKDWARLRERWRANALGRAALGAASFFYGLAMRARRELYARRMLKSQKLRAKVLCIGNLTTGGTGKTPAVLLAATTLRKRNVPIAILSRGYGRAARKGKGERVTTLLDDAAPPWTECGDEPWMMHHALLGQNVPILVSPDRTRAGEQAIDFYHSRLLILDDGFQHLRLRRDLDVVLVNALDPFGGGSVLPLGNLREPPNALARAGMIVLTHADAVEPERLDAIKEELQRYNKKAPVLESAHKPDFLLDPRTGEKHPLKTIAGRKVVSFCGLGDPKAFEDTVERLGAEVAQRWRYPDHYPYSQDDLASIARVAGDLPMVTTFKDFTRLPMGWERSVPGQILVLSIKLEITKGRNVWIDTLLKLAGETPEREAAA
jgi:tetraacyldisaccharide 4'-kinase